MTVQQDLQLDERTAETVQLLDVLGRLIRTARAAGHRHQAEYGLSGTPLGILKTLAVTETRAGDLAVRLQVAPSVVSRALVPLEQVGLVERTHDPDDARASRLRLTEEGRQRLERARRDFAGRFSPLLEDWPTDDVATLTRLMDRLETTITDGLDLGPTARTTAAPLT